MTPSQHIAKLDRWIAVRGEPVDLVRVSGAMPNQTTDTISTKAWVRPARENNLVGTVKDADLLVTLSPTDVTWSEIKTTDKITIQGKRRSIVAPLPQYFAGQLVRYDLHVTG